MSDVIKSEFATIDKDRQGIKTKHEQRAAAAAEKAAKESRNLGIAAFLTFVAMCLYYAIVIGAVIRGRCPKCHAYYETKLIRVDDLGIKQEKTREQSSKTVRDVTLTKRRLHTKTYQLYANVYECEDCGHVWKYNDRRLISDEK